MLWKGAVPVDEVLHSEVFPVIGVLASATKVANSLCLIGGGEIPLEDVYLGPDIDFPYFDFRGVRIRQEQPIPVPEPTPAPMRDALDKAFMSWDTFGIRDDADLSHFTVENYQQVIDSASSNLFAGDVNLASFGRDILTAFVDYPKFSDMAGAIPGPDRHGDVSRALESVVTGPLNTIVNAMTPDEVGDRINDVIDEMFYNGMLSASLSAGLLVVVLGKAVAVGGVVAKIAGKAGAKAALAGGSTAIGYIVAQIEDLWKREGLPGVAQEIADTQLTDDDIEQVDEGLTQEIERAIIEANQRIQALPHIYIFGRRRFQYGYEQRTQADREGGTGGEGGADNN